MFDPSKLDLNLDENKDKKDIPLVEKTESEKIEEHKQNDTDVSQSDNADNSSKDDLEELLSTPKIIDVNENIIEQESPELTTNIEKTVEL
jgi:hypothetical protein